jgi:MinD superfamily P-loop ATPase
MKIAIASGKGGTGKTFVSTNLFWVAQSRGASISLIDCDAEEPNVRQFFDVPIEQTAEVRQHVPIIDNKACVFCGKCSSYCNYNAIVYVPSVKLIRVMEDLCHDCGACIYACNFSAIIEKEKKVGLINTSTYGSSSQLVECRTQVGIHSPVAVIKKAIKNASAAPLCLLDSPPGISCPFIATVEHADFVLLVTEPTPFGLNDLRLSVETLRTLNKAFAVVINRAGLGDRQIYEYLAKEQIPILLEIPFDKNLALLYSEGKIASQVDKKYSQLFEKLWDNIRLVNTQAPE